jgi:hypothetical protein
MLQLNNESFIECECGMPFALDPEDKSVSYYCQRCKKTKCIKCKKDKHSGKCNFDEMLKSLQPENWFTDEQGKLIKVLACPFCGEVISKGDDGCDHMKCYSCKNDFNYCCSSRRSPAFVHGVHYHRPSCKYIDEDNKKFIASGCQGDKFDEKCEECKRLGRLCDLPKDLY